MTKRGSLAEAVPQISKYFFFCFAVTKGMPLEDLTLIAHFLLLCFVVVFLN